VLYVCVFCLFAIHDSFAWAILRSVCVLFVCTVHVSALPVTHYHAGFGSSSSSQQQTGVPGGSSGADPRAGGRGAANGTGGRCASAK
jgi:hypothetical protein